MSERTTVTVGPWPERGDDESQAELVSMTADTFEQLIDELGKQSQENARLRAALALRPAVSLATGVLMCCFALEEEDALDLLVRRSGHHDVGLREFSFAVLELAARDPASLGESLFDAPAAGAPA